MQTSMNAVVIRLVSDSRLLATKWQQTPMLV